MVLAEADAMVHGIIIAARLTLVGDNGGSDQVQHQPNRRQRSLIVHAKRLLTLLSARVIWRKHSARCTAHRLSGRPSSAYNGSCRDNKGNNSQNQAHSTPLGSTLLNHQTRICADDKNVQNNRLHLVLPSLTRLTIATPCTRVGD
jgi:hypothetical protein